jgi:tRNA(adenine34) deaminase
VVIANVTRSNLQERCNTGKLKHADEEEGAEFVDQRPMGDASISSMPETSRKTAAPKRSAKTRKWVRTVTTDSTYPPRGTFTGSASEIARTMARKDVSPGGIGSGIRMIQYFINRGGKNLSATRRAELEKAKRILQRRVARQKATTKKR